MFSSNATLLLLEVFVYLGAAAVAFLLPANSSHRFTDFENAWSRFAQRRIVSILAVIGFVLVVRGALAAVLPTPIPGVHDEFSYLLAGDTFASGRLTNPPHPLWKSLETFYVIQKPTYASMYPPAQGLAIALGDVITGRPWTGVLISVAVMAGLICWMLQGWVPAQWALLGALVSALRLSIYSYWSESYWGGAVAAIGGALVLGALPRILRKATVSSALVLGIGLLILANSRPYEGVLLALPVFGVILFRLIRSRSVAVGQLFRNLVLPLTCVLALGLGGMTFYFWRVTGNPFRMPYQVHSEIYEVTGPFLWQPLRKTPVYRYAVMEKYHVVRQRAAYFQAHSVHGWTAETGRKAESLLIFYFWPAVLPALFALPFLRRDWKVQFTLLVIVIMFVGLTLEIWPMTLHYHAPITAATALLLVQVMRFWRLVRWKNRPVGLAISRAIPIFCAALLAFRVSAAILHVPVPEHALAPWFTVAPGNTYRQEISDYLEHQPGLQLVFVRYSEDHHVDEEWVHNAANIDASKVVWVRFADDAQNKRVREYYPQRRAWLVEVGEKEGRLSPLGTVVAAFETNKKSGITR